ncbi:MAG TPA: nitronate monooxygenase [Solirubrobacteraceae bacterium]|jgi:nitronate monooxygenase
MSSRVLDALATPVVLAPLGGGPSTPKLAAAVCEAGGLGFLAFAYLSPQDAAARLRATRELTSRALGVNVFMPVPGPAEPESYSAFTNRLGEWAQQRGFPIGTPTFSDDSFDAKVELLLADAPAVISVTFGCPERSFVERVHAAGSEAWITVTTPDEARAAAGVGADALVVQGAEAGGHRGGFSDGEQQPVYGLLSLLQLVSAEVDIPIVASGGIASGAGIAAALCAGAAAVQLGSAFMLAPEAGTSVAHREALRRRTPTTMTRAFSGRTARAIRNAFIDAHDANAVAAFPEIQHVTSPIRKAARDAGDADAINLWAGEAYPLARELPAGEIVREMTRDAAVALRLAGSALRRSG